LFELPVDIQSSFSSILAIIAVLVWTGLLILLVNRRKWAPLERRFALYLSLALISSFSVIATSIPVPSYEFSVTLARVQFYLHAAQPIFFYAFARAFIRPESKPLGFLIGLALFALMIVCDLTMVSLNSAYVGHVPTATILISIRVLIWVIFSTYIPIVITRELRHTTSPFDRNRMAYLVLALPFFVGYDGLDLVFGDDARVFVLGGQLVGVLVLGYAVTRYELIDLRRLVRQMIGYVVITVLTALLYIFVFGTLMGLARRVDLASEIVVVFVLSFALALIYQPLYFLVRREIDTILFGNRYDVQAVVQEFGQRLSAQSELERLVLEGRELLRRTFGAIEVALLLVRRDGAGYKLIPIPQLPDWPKSIQLDEPNSVLRSMSSNGPLFQYDLERLPRYADIPDDAKVSLKRLASELYVPIQKNGSVIGIWVLGPKFSGDRYTSSDLSLLSTLSDQSAVALENARLVADLRDQMRQMSNMRDYLNSTLSSIANGVITLDRETKITSVNQAAEVILGIQASVAIGMPYDRVLPPLDGAQLPILINRVLSETAQHIVRDAVAQTPNRGTVNLSLHLSAMRQGNELLGVAIVFEDLAEQARLEKERRSQEEEKSRVRGTFERYVAPSVVEQLLADPRAVTLGGERHTITVLFADLHGFTQLSEKLPPEELIHVLNGYLSLAAQVVVKHEGTLDKFLGDGFMAIFNAPLEQADHPRRAAFAALALEHEARAYAKDLPELLQLTFRVGLHTGDAIVGNIGTNALMNYTAVGDTVNSAKRLQEKAEGGQILMSKDTYELVEEDVVAIPIEPFIVKGLSKKMQIFELIDLKNPNSNHG
jgi:adenylate cyclase